MKIKVNKIKNMYAAQEMLNPNVSIMGGIAFGKLYIFFL